MIATVILVLLFVGSFATPIFKYNPGLNVRYDVPSNQSKIQHPLIDRKLQANIGKGSHTGRSTIVGGIEASPHEYPWQVFIKTYVAENEYFSCGGSLISDQWVLTAAHCFVGKVIYKVVVVLGAHDLEQHEEQSVFAQGVQIDVHPLYDYPRPPNHDIAVLALGKRIKFNDFIQPIDLASPDLELDDGTLVTATGWGVTEDNESSNVLLEVTVPIMNRKDCAKYYLRGEVTPSNICTDKSGQHGTCNGDSGGPLIYKSDGTSKLIGLTSFGSPDCSPSSPDVFTEVNNYRHWIRQHTGI